MTRLALLLASGWLAFAPSARAAQDAVGTCVGVQVGERQSYDCLNAALARLAVRSHVPQVTGTLDAASPAPAIGAFNQTATHERMGNTFGRSVLSQRPPPPVYVTPLLGPRQ